jgi:hypothetical protein
LFRCSPAIAFPPEFPAALWKAFSEVGIPCHTLASGGLAPGESGYGTSDFSGKRCRYRTTSVQPNYQEASRNCAKCGSMASISMSSLGMLRKKGKKELDNSTLAGVKKELAKPRIAKSARITERNLVTTPISQRLDNRRVPD